MRTKLYVHTDKDSNYEKGLELGLSGEALRNFLYACLEVELDVFVNKYGDVTILAVDGIELKRPE